MKNFKPKWIAGCCIAAGLANTPVLASALVSENLFVDPINGLDTRASGRDGSITLPFKTIKFAINYGEKEFNSGVTVDLRKPYTVQLRGGTYDEVLTKSGVKGTAERPITIQAYNGEDVTFDSTIDVSGGWVSQGGNIYSKHIGEDIWQLFTQENGQWQEKMNARWPNARFGDKRGDVESVYTRESWAHANETGNAIGVMADDSLASDPNINNIDLTGALVVANVGSFDSWTRKITSHSPGNSIFEYGATPRIWKKQKHFYYFVEGKAELLDNDDEWYFDRASKTAYIYSSTGVPTGIIRAKNRPYAITVGGWHHVTVKDVNFFGGTLRCGNCENFTLEDSNFEYGGSSRRALGISGQKSEILFVSSNNRDLSHSSNNTLRNVTVKNVDGQGFLMRGNRILVENSSFKNIDWAATETYAPSSALVLDGNFSTFRYNTVKTAGSSETLATAGAPPIGSGKYTGPLGGVITAEYNDISDSGFAQSDGAMIQLRIAAQKGSIVRYNWLHDSPKYGVRFDAPIPATLYGSEAIAHHNVIWNANGMMIKGEDQRVYHNTIFNTNDPKRSDLIILDDADVGGVLGGANKGSIVINNAADVISSQRASIEPMLSWVDYGHNFNGANESQSLASQLRDINNRDFRPAQPSALNNGDAITDSYLINQQGGEFAYGGAYQQGQNNYWIPGRQEQQTSHPIPASRSADIATNTDLIWRPAYKTTSYKVYMGTSSDSLSLMKQQTNNIFQPDKLNLGTTYYWRVDALTAAGDTIIGDVWHFSTPQAPVKIAEQRFEEYVDGDQLTAWQTTGKAHAVTSSAFTGNLGARIMKSTTIEKQFSTQGYHDIQVTYARNTEKLDEEVIFDESELLSVTWSVDGTTWHTLEQSNASNWQTVSFDLPESANNQSGFTLRFSLNASNASERAHIDDIQITGLAD
mgnify:CR=1 FL=1